MTVTPAHLRDCSEKRPQNHIAGTGPRPPTRRGDDSSRAGDELRPAATGITAEGRGRRRCARSRERGRGSGTAGGEASPRRPTRASLGRLGRRRASVTITHEPTTLRARREPPEVKHLVIKHRPQEVWGQVARRFMTDVDVRRPEEVTTARGSLPRRLSPVCARGKDPACVPGPSSNGLKRESRPRECVREHLYDAAAREHVSDNT